MKGKILLLSLTFLFIPVFVLAASEVEIFSREYLSSEKYLESGISWQVYNNSNTQLFFQDQGALIKNDGDAYLVYPVSFSNDDFDVLSLTVKSSESLEVVVIPNVSTTGYNTYELSKKIPGDGNFHQLEFSLHLPFFSEPLTDLGIRLKSTKPSEVIISNVSLIDASAGWAIGQFFKDYLTVSNYSPFTVNLIPTPRIFGYSAMVYFLPIAVLVLLFLFLHPKKKFRQGTLIALMIFWVATDFRMTYEFINYNIQDYQSYIKPGLEDKSLRNYSDFYQFAELVKSNVPDDSQVNFYNFGSGHFPRILQYQVYPTIIIEEGTQGPYFAFYNYPGTTFNEDDQRLYQDGQAITEAGEIIARINNSFIFQTK